MQPLEYAPPELNRALLSKVATIATCALAGSVGGRRAWYAMSDRPSGVWVRRRSAEEAAAYVNAHHEASHALAGTALNRGVWHLSIVPDPAVRCGPSGRSGYVAGLCTYGDGPPAKNAKRKRAGREFFIKSDIQIAAEVCFLLAHPMGWQGALRFVRIFRARAEEIVTAECPRIVELAHELELRRELDQKQIAAVLGRPCRPAAASSGRHQ